MVARPDGTDEARPDSDQLPAPSPERLPLVLCQTMEACFGDAIFMERVKPQDFHCDAGWEAFAAPPMIDEQFEEEAFNEVKIGPAASNSICDARIDTTQFERPHIARQAPDPCLRCW